MWVTDHLRWDLHHFPGRIPAFPQKLPSLLATIQGRRYSPMRATRELPLWSPHYVLYSSSCGTSPGVQTAATMLCMCYRISGGSRIIPRSRSPARISAAPIALPLAIDLSAPPVYPRLTGLKVSWWWGPIVSPTLPTLPPSRSIMSPTFATLSSTLFDPHSLPTRSKLWEISVILPMLSTTL